MKTTKELFEAANRYYDILDHIERLKENIQTYSNEKTERNLHFVKFELKVIKEAVEEIEKETI